jgi:hypothetical protein
MSTLLGRVVSKNELGHALLRVHGQVHERDRGQRVELELDDGNRAYLFGDAGLDVRTARRDSGPWAVIAGLPLGHLFADLNLADETECELEAWLIREDKRLAIEGSLSGTRITATRVAIFEDGEADDAAILRLGEPKAQARPKAAPVPVAAVDADTAALVNSLDDDGERHIEMSWHCGVCKTKNLGRFKNCQGCGKPKDREEYEMPEDLESAATVTDAALLRMATAGPDWRCAYCNSDQRASDGNCGNCGASSTAVPEPEVIIPAPKPRTWIKWVVAAGVAVVALIAVLIWNAKRPHTYDGTVSAVAWSQVIDVEHYANHDHEGFQEQIPGGATEVTSVGQKLHHNEQVLDHMETEHYTERVPDGYSTEHYTEQVSCGQDCTETPKSCHQECTSKKNGFASCKQVCSGGGRNCTTKYCSESRTRQVARTRTEDRTREVPRYRSEPRYAEAFKYKAWDWVNDRTVHAEGTESTGVHWPDNGARTTGLADGEVERETRHATYAVTLKYDGKTVRFAVPTETALAPFATNSKHPVRRVEQALFVDNAPIKPIQ